MSNSNHIKPAKWLYPLSVEYNRQKVCTCSPPHYILDAANRLVYCRDCGAILDPFDALMHLAENWDTIHYAGEDATEQIKQLEAEVEKFKTAFFSLKTTNNLAENFKHGFQPVCPKCGEAFDPSKIEDFQKKLPFV